MEGTMASPVRMSSEGAGSPARPRKMTLVDFIHKKRTNPDVNLTMRSRPLTPHSCVTSVNGSTYDIDAHSTDKPTSTISNRRDSSRTYSSGDEDDDEEMERGKKSRRKKTVFSSDGHGKRESYWKSESVRRIRLSTLIHKSRESSAQASDLDVFNDSRSGYSLDIVSRQSTRHPPYSGESKRSRRERGSRGDNRHTSYSHHGSDVHRPTRKRTQTAGESRGSQTSPILYHRIDDKTTVNDEVKSQPIREVDEEFDYPLSQLLLEYPYNPKAKETEIKTTETATEILPTDLQVVQRPRTIGINITSSADGGKQIYDADGTVIIVTAFSEIDPVDRVTHTDKSKDYQSIVVSEQKKPDTNAETKAQWHDDNKPITNNPIMPNTTSQNSNQSGNTSKTHEPVKGFSGNDPNASTDNLNMSSTISSSDITEDKSNQVAKCTDLLVPATTLEFDSLQQNHTGIPVVLGTDNEISSVNKSSVETSSDIKSNELTAEKDTSVKQPLDKDDSGDQPPDEKVIVEPPTDKNNIIEPPSDKDIRVESSPNKTENVELQLENTTSVETPSHINNSVEQSHDTDVSVTALPQKDTNVETPDKESRDEASLDITLSAEQSTINTSDQGSQHTKVHRESEDVKKEHRSNASPGINRQKPEMDQEKKRKTEKTLLDACRRELSDEVQLGQAVLKVIKMWKDSAVVRSFRDKEQTSDRASSSTLDNEMENRISSSSDQSSSKSSEADRTVGTQLPGGQRLSNEKGIALKTTAKSQPKEIQIVIRNPVRSGASNKESAVKIVIKLPIGLQQQSSVSTPEVAEVSKPSNDTDDTDHQQGVESPEVPKQEPQEVPNQESEEVPEEEPQEVPNEEPPPEVDVIPVKNISETHVLLPTIPELVPSERNHGFKRLRHGDSGKRRTPSLISVRQATVTTATIRMREVDGVICSNKGVYIGHDRKLYNTFRDASETSRVDRILENFKEMRNGNIGQSEFLYDQANDDVFQTHLDSFRRGNSHKSKVNGSIVLAASKLYSQARTRKAKAYSNLHKKLTSAVNY